MAAYHNFGKKVVVNPGMEGYGMPDLQGGWDARNYESKKAGYVARMIYDENYHKLNKVKEPSKYLKNLNKPKRRGRPKKGGSMYLSGGALDIDVKAAHKSVLLLI